MSSVAYAPEEIFLTLSLAGVAAYAISPWVGLAVVVVLLTVVTSYRQNVHAYPSGGGDYEVATVNLGRHAGLTVASALLVDYTLTVAVSISAAAANVGALVPLVAEHKVALRRGGDRPAHRGQPAGHPRIGCRVRHPDLRVHGRHRDDDRSGV